MVVVVATMRRQRMRDRRLSGLYAVTPDAADENHLLAMADAALAGGARLLQYRDKAAAAGRRRRLADALCAACRRRGALFIVNDDPVLALACGADGVHLGADDGDLAAVRRELPAGMLLGASCYADFARARTAVASGADYVAFGAVCSSPTKPQSTQAPLELFARCRTELAAPACAIGGITLATAPAVVAAGADMLAIITGLFGAPDIARRAADFQQLFQEPAA